MKTLLIDPYTQTITEHDYDGTLGAMYKLIGCGLVEPVYANNNGKAMFKGENCLFVDEEGLLKDLDTQAFFIINGKPISGRAITVSYNEEGETTEAGITLSDLEKLEIKWMSLTELKDILTSSTL